MKQALYWHIRSLNHWREVVVEQLRVLKAAGWTEPVNVGFAGSEEEFGFVWHAFSAAGTYFSPPAHLKVVKNAASMGRGRSEPFVDEFPAFFGGGLDWN